MKLFPEFDQNFWRRSTNFWSIIFFVAIIADYITSNAFDKDGLIFLIAVFYTGFLAIYSAEKEFKRWHNYNQSMHPGEMYVIVWTILIIAILGANLYFKKEYELPAEVRALYIVVVSILALTKESKLLYRSKKKRK